MKRFPVVLALLTFAAVSPAAAKVIHIDVNGLVFSPEKVTAQVGDTLEWTNKDFVLHSATAKDKEWDIPLPAHGNGSLDLKKSGHVDYYCKYHPTMKGTIDVAPASR